MSKPSTALYRKIIQEAWQLTWRRKALWIFGIFAAVISTGGVMDIAMATLKKVEVGGNLLEQLMNSSFIGYQIASQYILQIEHIGTARAAGIITASTLVLLLVIVLAVLSQGALVLGAKNKEVPDPRTLRKEAHRHFWQLFSIASLTKIANALLVILMTLPLLLFYLETTRYSTAIFFLSMLIFLPAVLIVNIISMLALIDIVVNNRPVILALEHAVKIFSKHWVATIEFSFLLFCVVFGAGILLIALISLLTLPYAIIYSAALLSGSFSIFVAINVFSTLVMMTLILAFGGSMVSFQYTAWYLFYKRASHKTLGVLPFAKIFRLLNH